MSAAVYISFEVSTSAEEIAADGKNIMIHLDSLSAIGEDHGLKRLDDYVSFSSEEIFDLLSTLSPMQEGIEGLHQEQWFDPKEGLRLIENYIDLVRNYYSLSDTTKGQCLPELETYRDVFMILVKENARWHFSYDI